jgi:triacylglycerol lipase
MIRTTAIRLLCLWVALLLQPRAEAVWNLRVEEQKATGDYVVLVHGVQWMRDSLQPTADYFHQQGYHTINVRWPTRRFDSVELAAERVRALIADACPDQGKKIHLIGHSMGSIVIRHMLQHGTVPRLGRIVLLAPPNQGTPLARFVKGKVMRQIVGRPVQELIPGTAGTPSQLSKSLPVAPGIIMGTKSGWFPLLSAMIPGPDDGVVPVEGGRLRGMRDFLVLPVSHTSMPHHEPALAAALRFVRLGSFGQGK